MSLLQHTQYQVLLSVNVITQDDTGSRFIVLPLLSLSWLIMGIWQCRLLANRFTFTLRVLTEDLTEWLQIAGKVLGIGFNSLAWGLL